MKTNIMAIIMLSFFMSSVLVPQTKLKYPLTKKDDVKDNYFGTIVPDPYRWLENDTASAVKQWVKEENKVTFSYLDKIPYREKIKARLEKLWNYPKYSAPFKAGKNYFFFKNDGLQNQAVLYIQDGLNAKPEVFLDPNNLSKDGTVSLSAYAPSKDGKYFAYGTASGGSDWNEFHVMDVATKKVLSDELKWIKFSGIAWFKDGFFYSRYPTPAKGEELTSKNEFHKVYYHKLGTEQSSDSLIYENLSQPKLTVGAQTTEDERFLILYLSTGTSNNALYVQNLEKPGSSMLKVIDNYDHNYSIVDNIGDKLLVLTDKNAPKYRLVLIDPENPGETNWQTIIPEKNDVLQSVSVIGGKLVAIYMKDASNRMFMYNLSGNNEEEIKLPVLGTIESLSGKRNDNIAFYDFTSFTFPPTIYELNINDNTSTIFRKPEINFNFDNYITKQVFYNSKDGTKVPMFIVYKKGLKRNGNNPAFLYAYGGFDISINPAFSITRLIFLENGGVLAIPNIRGGGEYGEAWHKAGMLGKKQNVFDDFIAAAKYLIKEKYTSSQRLAINGASNGGMLIGAVTNQRPDLFRVAIPQVGVQDMLRFQKFTIGWAWVNEYGSSDDSAQFQYLYKYSPLQNIRSGVNYPSIMATTADHDDRVVPAHSFKYIATLQDKYKGNNPILIRIETRAGHGAGKPTSKIIDEWTDIWSFIFYNFGIKPVY
ncbi:MAG TPA: prolyl oligopeptidase family serine peptidase [Ignavibacteriaceae bacterium]|nr:prolyl oligopeptidase family serine peptidase [Ignavibacteriaceae bacterium]